MGSRVTDFGFRVSGFGFRVPGFGFRVSGFGFRGLGFEFRVSGSWIRGWWKANGLDPGHPPPSQNFRPVEIAKVFLL